jgi:surfeit locus 1 family protein
MVAAATGIAVTASLGQWQLTRASQKEALQAARDLQASKEALDAAALRREPSLDSLLHRPVVLRGTWVRERTVYLDNRQMNARVGFFVFTPLIVEGGGAILVQRGWVPRNFEQRTVVPAVDTPAGVVEVRGRMAPPPSKLYEPGTPGTGAIRQNLDLQAFVKESSLPLMSMTVLQTGLPSDGLLREWPAVNLGVDKHYGYAFQWFGLSALIAGLTLWFQFIRRFFVRLPGA